MPLSLDSLEQPPPSPLTDVYKNYPGLEQYGFQFKDSIPVLGDIRKLEFYSPGESHSTFQDKTKPGIERMDPSMGTNDIFGEMLHYLPSVDGKVKAFREEFQNSISPSQAEKWLKGDYQHEIEEGVYGKNPPPYKEWLKKQGGDALFRGYLTKQFPEEAYTPGQKQLFSKLDSYLKNTPKEKPLTGGLSLDSLELDHSTESEPGTFSKFLMSTWDTFKKSNEHIVDDPVETAKGEVKAVVGGLVGMGEMAIKGLTGIARSTLAVSGMVPGDDGTDVTGNMLKGQEAADEVTKKVREIAHEITTLNTKPSNEAQETAEKLLALLPEGAHAVGEGVYEKTGSALAGAGSEALLNLLLMKPEIASKSLGALKRVKGKEAVTPETIEAAQVVQEGFDGLVKDHPEAAEKVVEHVGKADPELEALLRESMAEVAKKPGEMPVLDLPKEAVVKGTESTGQGTAETIKLYRGVEEGRDPHSTADTFESTHFYSPLDSVAEKFAGEKGTVIAKDVEFKNRLDTETYAKAKVELELPKAATMADVIKAAKEKGYDGLSFKSTNGKEYVHFPEERGISPEAAKSRVELIPTENGYAVVVDGNKKSGVEYTDFETAKTDRDAIREALIKGENAPTTTMDKLGKAPEYPASGSKPLSPAELQNKLMPQAKGVSVEELNGEISKVEIPQANAIHDTMKEGYESLWQPAEAVFPPSKIIPPSAEIVTNPAFVKATQLVNNALDSTPIISSVKGKLEEYLLQIQRNINPESLGEGAKVGAAVVSKRIAEQMQKDSSYFHQAEVRRAFWDKNIAKVKDFLKIFETGKKFVDPDLQRIADFYREWNKKIFAQDAKLKIEYEAQDNYLYHAFEDSKGVANFFERKYGSKWGEPGFTKERSFELYEQAVAAGFKPKFKNPEDLMLARQHASDVAEMRISTLAELEQYGYAKKVKKAGETEPSDYPSTRWKAPNGDVYWVQNEAALILHNAFNTKSMWTMEGMAGDAFRGAMWLKNTIVPIRLALSLFHPLHVQTIDNATGMVRASKELLSGTKSPGSWMKAMAGAIMYKGIWDNPKMGNRLRKVWQGKIEGKDFTPADIQALQYMFDGGFIPEMSSQYRTKASENFRTAIRQGSFTALWHAPFAALSAIQKPMFEVWIPNLKIASYLNDVKTAIKVDPSLLDDPMKRTVAFHKIAKSIDNRYGEMTYSTLFWNRWVKDLAVANTLSLGWQMGFIREYGGAGMDIGQFATKTGGLTQKVKTGMLDRPLFVTFYTAQALAYGGLMTYLLSGQELDSLLDYTFPKSGGKEPDGTDSRVGTMFYPKEFVAIGKHIEHEGVFGGLSHTVMNKASGVVGLTKEWATGVDDFGKEIRDPNAPAYKQLEQTLVHTMTGLEPISLQAIRDGQDPYLSVAGFSKAPKYVTETKTEGAIKSLYQKYYGTKQTPFEKAEVSMDRRKLRELYNAGDPAYGDLLDSMREKYDLTGNELKTLEKNLAKNEDYTVIMFTRMTWQQQKKLLDDMTPEERELYLPHSNKQHLRHSYEEPVK